MTRFADRRDAGRQLAAGLTHLAGQDLAVLGIPRGGVPVAFEVARELGAPLDVVVVRKLGLPFQPEVAMGAIGEGGVRVLDPDVIAHAGVLAGAVRAVEQRERPVLEARVGLVRRGRPRLSLHGRTVIVVDDGIATGATVRAACEVVRRLGAARVVLAVPVAPAGTTAEELSADELVCCSMPLGLRAVSDHYRDFTPSTDEEVVRLLDEADCGPTAAGTPARVGGGPSTGVEIVLDADVVLRGDLVVPPGAHGIVVFAHGSGSNRLSPRNRYVAQELRAAGIGTLLIDLLTAEEADQPSKAFDIPLLGSRLAHVCRWVVGRPGTTGLRVGLYGSSTGAGAALWAAAEPGSPVAAVVSRGGRPQLAADRLLWVVAPTLLVVGGSDENILEQNRRAQARMPGLTRLVVVPKATHLFEEPGALAQVARLASAWFTHYLVDGEDAQLSP